MTIKEIATTLNLSTSTVSKALNNATDVSEATRKRVNSYAQAAGFSLRSNNESKRICVLFENMDSHSNSQVGYPVLTGFQQAANAYHYEIVIEHCTDKNPPNLKKLCDENKFRALMILGTKLSSEIMKELETTNVPIMLMESYVKNPKVACISSDNINSVTAIVAHLIELGHRKIGFLGGDMESIVTRERFSGYLIGLTEGKIEYRSDYVQYGNYTENCGLDAADYFAKTDVTAVVCASDLIAIGLINGLKKYGIRVPEDISVVGFDGLRLGSFLVPKLSTVEQSVRKMAVRSVEILLDCIEKGGNARHETVPFALRLRESTRKI